MWRCLRCLLAFLSYQISWSPIAIYIKGKIYRNDNCSFFDHHYGPFKIPIYSLIWFNHSFQIYHQLMTTQVTREMKPKFHLVAPMWWSLLPITTIRIPEMLVQRPLTKTTRVTCTCPSKATMTTICMRTLNHKYSAHFRYDWAKSLSETILHWFGWRKENLSVQRMYDSLLLTFPMSDFLCPWNWNYMQKFKMKFFVE